MNTSKHDQLNKIIQAIPSCNNGCVHGLLVFADKAKTSTKLCSCVTGLPEDVEYELKARGSAIEVSGLVPLFADELYGDRTFGEVAPTKLVEWLTETCRTGGKGSHVFLCGKVGTGKTHLASDCLKLFIIRTGCQAHYTTASFLAETKTNAIASNSSRARNYEPEELKKLRNLEYALKCTGLFVIDEIRESLTKRETSFLEEFIDKRYQSGLSTIYISNHTFNADTSYKRLSIEKVIGDRSGDRLRNAVVCEFSGKSKRGIQHLDSIAEAQLKNFCFSPSVLALGNDNRQILNFLTRNHVFEPINRKDREINRDSDGNVVHLNGSPADVHRENPKISESIWQKGHRLTLEGPILCRQDAKTYITCLHLLKLQHCRGELGLIIRLTPTCLMTALGLNPTSVNGRASLQRSLARITAASLDYIDNGERRWTGPLFLSTYERENHDGAYLIHFNKSMIPFYEACEYTVLPNRLLNVKSLGTDSFRMIIFLLSHVSDRYIPTDPTFWLKFLGKPVELMDGTVAGKALARRYRQKFAKDVRTQIELGFLTPDSGLMRNGKVILRLAQRPQTR